MKFAEYLALRFVPKNRDSFENSDRLKKIMNGSISAFELHCAKWMIGFRRNDFGHKLYEVRKSFGASEIQLLKHFTFKNSQKKFYPKVFFNVNTD